MKKSIHGFSLKKSHKIKEIKATAHLFEHDKSKAELFYLECDDNNKVFSATFMTLPEDSTGCPHILEHSVLNGSKNFPAKSTFNELLKGSLHTFINAMTGSDTTYYPIASTNQKDFQNLMRVYLDAVFFPKIYTDPEILKQEGWHYELESPEAELNIRGVVYNEMKGAFSSPDRIISMISIHRQFPDSPYGFVSGGDPEVIPELSYEKFLEFHSKYYHPSNCRLFLYGDMDLEENLKLIDQDYLSHFEAIARPDAPPLQKPFDKPMELSCDYPAGEGQDLESAYHLTMTYTHSHISNLEDVNAMGMIGDLLLNSPAASLKNLVLQSGLAQDALAYVYNDLFQPTISLVFKQVHKNDLEKLRVLVQNELERLAKEGFDKKLVEACISSREFVLREAQTNYPKGLYYHWAHTSGWIHCNDPISMLEFEPLLAELKRGIKEPYFEDYLKRAMLENTHASIITFVPNPHMVAQQEQALKDRLAAYKAGLSKEEIDRIVAETKHLIEYQNAPDDPEDLKKIPGLQLSDINPIAEEFPRELDESKDYTLIKHPMVTNGIAYLKLYYDLSHASEDDLPWLQLYTTLVGEIDSQNYGYRELSNEVDINTGGINLALSFLPDYEEPDFIHRNFQLASRAVKDKIPQMLELMLEYAHRPLFEDEDRLRSKIRQIKSRWEAYLMRSGISVAITRMLKPFSQLHRWNDICSGLEHYHFIRELERDLDQRMPELIRNMNTIKDAYFTRRNLLVSITADAELIESSLEQIDKMVQTIPYLEPDLVDEHFVDKELNEGIAAPVKIQFVAKGGNFFRKGYSYSGKLRVLSNILRNEFLHKEIRVKGGAYGAMVGFSMAGHQYFASYMDPNLEESLDVYDKVADYLRGFEADEAEMHKFIIGEISSLDYPYSPERKGTQATEDFITGFGQSDKQQIRDEVLATSVEDIRSFADMIEDLMGKNHYAVFGNEDKIRQNAGLFDTIIPVFGDK